MAARWLNGRNMFAPKTPNGSQDRRPRSRLQTSRISEVARRGRAILTRWRFRAREGQMRFCLRRREFIALLGGGWPLAARAQQGGRMRRIGVLMPYDENDP